jgi:hypothetical protein
MKFYIGLNREEIQSKIPYSVVAETMSGAKWNTGRRKRLMKEQFTEAEIEATYRLHRQARDWYLYKGVPEEVQMTLKTYDLWQKLGNFCCEI